MDFKEKIRLQNEGKYNFTNELLEKALSDIYTTKMVSQKVTKDFYNEEDGHYTLTFTRWRPEYKNGLTYEEILARNLKVWIARYVKKANGQRSKWLFEGSNSEINEDDVLDEIYTTFTDLGYHYYKDDFDKVPSKIWLEIEEKYGWEYASDLKEEFQQFLNILPSINREKKKLQDEYLPLIKESLNEILPKVDLNRNEMEIIGFIAISTKREVNRKLTKLLNKIHQINGETYLVPKSDMKFNQKDIYKLLGIQSHKLSSNQYRFYDLLKKSIQKEMDNKNETVFTFNKQGYVIDFNKRYFSMKLEMNESAFKKRLHRLRNISNS